MIDLKVGDVLTVRATGSFGVVVDWIDGNMIKSHEYNHDEYTYQFNVNDINDERFDFRDYSGLGTIIYTDCWVDMKNCIGPKCEK